MGDGLFDVTTDRYLCCPLCHWELWVSPEDPDAALSELSRHGRLDHSRTSAESLLARAKEVRRARRQ